MTGARRARVADQCAHIRQDLDDPLQIVTDEVGPTMAHDERGLLTGVRGLEQRATDSSGGGGDFQHRRIVSVETILRRSAGSSDAAG
jgi:hypothetical protein